MKVARILLITALLAGSAAGAQAQRAVPLATFALRPSAGSTKAVTYGDTKATVVRVLGAPTKTSRFYYEMDRVWATVLHYGPNELHFVSGRLGSMMLHDGRWLIGPAGSAGFRVGAVPSKAALVGGPGAPLAFGTFAVENKPGTSYNLPYSAISWGGFRLPKGGVSDDGYAILFDKQGRVAHVFAE